MIPRPRDLRSSPMVHRFGDLYAAPGLTNFLGCVQVDIDLTGVRSLNFPPLATSDVITGGLYLNRRYFPSTGADVTITWQPDRIERTAEWDGFKITSTTVLAPQRQGVIVNVAIENLLDSQRQVEIKLGLASGVTKAVRTWNDALPPVEFAHDTSIDPSRAAVIFEAKASEAADVQGCYPPAERATSDGLYLETSIAPRGRWEFAFVRTLGTSKAQALSLFDEIAPRAREQVELAERYWDDELEAAFTPGNDRYSGSLPVLETSDDAIRRIYNMGALGVIYFKRDSPASAIGRAYDTLMPKYWQSVTFLWDYSLSSTVHALLDPTVMRKYLGLFMKQDMHKHFGIEWLTGGPVGPWYSVNDYAMTKTARDYLRWSGDLEWLTAKLPEANDTPLDHLRGYAHSWESFKTPNGLADYGGIGNLLECVSSYIHEVASLNSANAYNLRFIADLEDKLGGDGSGARASADELVKRVMDLYVEGGGYWKARMPDGVAREVMHCYDFLTVLNTIDSDLSESQKNEMIKFFFDHLRTPTWMRALSCSDNDAMFSVRPDHQWTGAYPAWPPMSALGLLRIGRVDETIEWVRAMASSANQGPFGQAHFAEDAFPPEAGGARKAPADFPYINDWSCSSNGAWNSLVIEGFFGLEPTLDKGLTSTPRFGSSFDQDARLVGIPYQGGLYQADADGVRPVKGSAS